MKLLMINQSRTLMGAFMRSPSTFKLNPCMTLTFSSLETLLGSQASVFVTQILRHVVVFSMRIYLVVGPSRTVTQLVKIAKSREKVGFLQVIKSKHKFGSDRWCLSLKLVKSAKFVLPKYFVHKQPLIQLLIYLPIWKCIAPKNEIYCEFYGNA